MLILFLSCDQNYMGIHWGIYEEEDGWTVECEAGHDDAGKATVKATQLISVYVICFCFYLLSLPPTDT